MKCPETHTCEWCRGQKFEEAKTIFVELESSIQDPVSAVFAGRCDEFMVRHTARAFLGPTAGC